MRFFLVFGLMFLQQTLKCAEFPIVEFLWAPDDIEINADEMSNDTAFKYLDHLDISYPAILDNDIWTKVTIRYEPSDKGPYYIICPRYMHLDLFDSSMNLLQKTGSSVLPQNRPVLFSEVSFLIHPKASVETYYILQKQRTFDSRKLQYQFLSTLEFNQYIYFKRSKSTWYHLRNIAFIAVLFFLILFTLNQYFYNKDKSYLWYGLYLFVVVFYYLDISENNAQINFIFSYFPFLFETYPYITPFSFLFYTLFTISFLNLDEHLPQLSQFMRKVNYLILFMFFIHLGIEILGLPQSINVTFYFIYRNFLNIPLIAILLIIATQMKTHPLYRYFIFGSFALFVGVLLSLIFTILQLNFGLELFNEKIVRFPSQLGIIIECLFFSSGLGVKSKIAFESRDKARSDLLLQMEENEKLHKKYNEDLQKEVEQKTADILIKNEQLIKSKYEMQIMNLEADLLQTQMNPHFIFNCLNSIKYFALTKDPKDTSGYITEFSKLMRIILQNSRKRLISIVEEIQFLKIYMGIEQKRFSDQFSYTIHIEKNLDTHKLKIPPMLIQPIVENAIVHGIMPKKNTGIIGIMLFVKDNNLFITVTDDGIGRNASKKVKNTLTKKSMSTNITENRLQVFNQLYEVNTSFKVKDLVDNKGKSIGTKVIVQLPLFT